MPYNFYFWELQAFASHLLISQQASAYELYLSFWKAVHLLSLFGFKVTFVNMDGAVKEGFYEHSIRKTRNTDIYYFKHLWSLQSWNIYNNGLFSHNENYSKQNI